MKKIKWIAVSLIGILLLVPSYVNSIKNSQALSGVSIVLDSGHGGKDMGASYQGVDEAPLNLAIVKKLEKRLQSLGCNVVLTRKDEHDLANDTAINRKKEDMKKRIEIINDEKNDLLVSIHMNKYPSEEVKGFQVFYQDDLSKLFAQYIQENANIDLKQNKQIKKGDFYIINNSRIPGVLIECGFISNSEDRHNLNDENYQNKLVECVVKGIVEYFESKGMN